MQGIKLSSASEQALSEKLARWPASTTRSTFDRWSPLSSGTVGMRNPLLHLLCRHLDHAGVGFLQQVADGLQCVRGKRREFGASLSQTQSD